MTCKFCVGAGCLACDQEHKRREISPMFTANRSNPDDMAELEDICGFETLKSAFSPGGRGVDEIEEKTAMARVKQILREEEERGNDGHTTRK